ncbi:MAG TPA: glutamate racemase [Abditibacterium sp.]|jgi:glutamate racemase
MSDFAPRIKIGIRDSGVGGLTVARRVRNRLPGADLLYFADTAHVPYGDKSPAQVRHYALSISQFLIEQGAQLVVFACNTTSAYALDAARARFEVPIFGVIEPGARVAAAVSDGKVGVLATDATVQSASYTRELQRLRPNLRVQEIGCPAFVPLVEAQKAGSLEASEACKHYLAPLLRFGADTIVLGCTHFPLLLPALQDAAPHLRFIDPAAAVAQEIAAHCGHAPAAATNDTFFVSGERCGVRHWVQTLLEIENPRLEPGPVFDYT